MRKSLSYPLLLGLVFLIVGTTGVTSTRASDTPDESPGEKIKRRIEKKQEDCVEKDSSTVGMRTCAEAAYVEWDREMNIAYKALMKELPVEGQNALREAQREWIKYRDKEFEAIDGVYSQMEGTMWIPIRIESRVRVVRERVLMLRHYLEILSER